MDAQYPFASREDIWRVHEEVKDLIAMQMEHGERLSKLERRREDDTRIKNLWGPFSPFPYAVSTPVNQGKFLISSDIAVFALCSFLTFVKLEG